MVRPNLYVGSKVRVWENLRGINDDVVQIMDTFVCILFERCRDTLSADGYGDDYGVMVLNNDGTAKSVVWWINGEECTVLDNDLAANQDFIYANRDLLESEEEDEDEEDEPDEREFEENEENRNHHKDPSRPIDKKKANPDQDLIDAIAIEKTREEIVRVADRQGLDTKGVRRTKLAEQLVALLPLNTIEEWLDGGREPTDTVHL